MKPGFFQGKKFPFTPKRRKKSLGSQCNNIIDTRHDLAAFRSKLANVSWLRSYTNEPWWHTWQHLIQPDAVWGVSASSVGASLGAFGGPTSNYELSFGALPLHEVVSSARRIVYLAQPGFTTDEFNSLLNSSQHFEVIILGVRV